jgi:hypothetical protein
MKYSTTYKPMSLNILVWSPDSRRGHLDSYHAIYTDLISRLGHNVIKVEFKFSIFQNMASKWTNQTNETLILVTVNLLNKYVLLEFFYNIYQKNLLLFKLLINYLHQIHLTKFKFDDLQIKYSWFRLYYVHKKIQKIGLKCDVILNLYIDGHSFDKVNIKFLEKIQLKWFAILFHTEDFDLPIQILERLKFFQGLLYIGGNNKVSKKFMIQIPDVIHTRIAETPTLPQRITNALDDNSEIKIGLVGSLDSRKDLKSFINLIKSQKIENVKYFLLGKIDWASFGFKNAFFIALNLLIIKKNDNFYIRNKYILDEETYNYIYTKLDLIYLIYSFSLGSSGSALKAAYFNNAVLHNLNLYNSEILDLHVNSIRVSSRDSLENSILKLISNSCPKKNSINDEFESLNNKNKDYIIKVLKTLL